MVFGNIWCTLELFLDFEGSFNTDFSLQQIQRRQLPLREPKSVTNWFLLWFKDDGAVLFGGEGGGAFIRGSFNGMPNRDAFCIIVSTKAIGGVVKVSCSLISEFSLSGILISPVLLRWVLHLPNAQSCKYWCFLYPDVM